MCGAQADVRFAPDYDRKSGHEVSWLLELFVEPAAHLRAGIAHGQAAHIELLAEVVDQILAFALIEPGILLAAVETERSGAEQRPGRILADVVVLGAVAQFDGAILDCVEHLQAGHDLTGGKVLNLKLAVRCLGNVFGKSVTSTVDRIERLRPAGRQAPFERRAGLRDRRLGDRGDGGAGAKSGKKLTAFHLVLPERHQTSKRPAAGEKLRCSRRPVEPFRGQNGMRPARRQETR